MKNYSIILPLLLLFSFCINFASAQTRMKMEENLLRTSALKINVPDMKKAVSFYVEKLGFEIDDKTNYPKQVVLKTNDRVKLILFKVGRLRPFNPLDTGISFTLQVNDLDRAIEKMRAAGIEFADTERRKEGVGYAISIRDPFGRKISLMHQTIVRVEQFKEPKIYNFGYYIPDMETGRDFYAGKLGFVVRSERYLPLDLPLGHADNSFGFMLHMRPGVNSIQNEYPKKMPFYTIVYETPDLQKAVDQITNQEIRIVDRTHFKDGRLQSIVFEDPFGNISEIVQSK